MLSVVKVLMMVIKFLLVLVLWGYPLFTQLLSLIASIITLLSLITKLTKSSHKQAENLQCNTLPRGSLLLFQRVFAWIHKEYSSYIAIAAVSIYF